MGLNLGFPRSTPTSSFKFAKEKVFSLSLFFALLRLHSRLTRRLKLSAVRSLSKRSVLYQPIPMEAQLQGMGFDATSVKLALSMNNNNFDNALAMLLNQSQHEAVRTGHGYL